MIPDTLIDFSAFIDGGPYAGKIEEIEPPALARKMEEYRGGGMDLPVEIDLGGEKMECTFSTAEYTPALIGRFGATGIAAIQFRFKGSVRNHMTEIETPIEVIARGRWSKVEWGTWKPGDTPKMKFSASLSYFEYVASARTIVKIDAPNMIHELNGKDLMALRRVNLGI